MDPARQIIRWSIPGALSLLTSCLVFVALHLPVKEDLSDALRPITDHLAPAAAIALSVPLGFLWFHVYDLLYHPRRRLAGFLPTNAGANVLGFLTQQQRIAVERAIPGQLVVPLHRIADKGDIAVIAKLGGGADMLSSSFASPSLVPIGRFGAYLARARVTVGPRLTQDTSSRWRRRLQRRRDRQAMTRLYKERWRTHYDLAAALVDISTLGEASAKLKDQWRGAYDIFHSLGASRYAIVGGLLGGFALFGFKRYKSQIFPEKFDTSVIAGVLVVLCVMAVVGLNRARGRRLDTSTQRLGYTLRVALAQHPELLEHLRDVPANAAGGLRCDTVLQRRAVLDAVRAHGIPSTFVWLRHHDTTGRGASWFAANVLNDETADEALVALSPREFQAALSASRMSWLVAPVGRDGHRERRADARTRIDRLRAMQLR